MPSSDQLKLPTSFYLASTYTEANYYATMLNYTFQGGYGWVRGSGWVVRSNRNKATIAPLEVELGMSLPTIQTTTTTTRLV